MIVGKGPPQGTEWSFLEVARGHAVPSDMTITTALKLSTQAKATAQIPWEEYWELSGRGGTSELSEPLPNGKDALPVLQLVSPNWKDWGYGPVRVRVWFDPKQAYLPVRMTIEDDLPDGQGRHSYYRSRVVEWSKPVTLPNGVVFAAACKIRIFDRQVQFFGEKQDDFLWKDFEATIWDIQFSEVSFNEALADSHFEFSPPEGTNVIDQVAGYRYSVGSAGAQLGKSAIDFREKSDAQDQHLLVV